MQFSKFRAQAANLHGIISCGLSLLLLLLLFVSICCLQLGFLGLGVDHPIPSVIKLAVKKLITDSAAFHFIDPVSNVDIKYNRPFYSCCLVTWPVNTSEAGVDLALIQTSLLFSFKCQLVSIRATLLTQQKQ